MRGFLRFKFLKPKLKLRMVVSVITAIGIIAASAGITAGGAAAWAKEPATPELTLAQAVEKALANSKALKTGEYDIERAEEVREKAADNVTWKPAGGGLSGEAAAVASRAFTGLVQADLAWQMSKKAYNAEKDSVVMSVYQAYNGVLQAREKRRAAELAYKSADLAHRAAVASLRAGVISKSDFLKSEAGLAGGKAGLEAAEKALADAYQKFNQLVGLWPEDRPVLVDRPSFSPLQIDSLDTEVERAVEESPSQWLAEKKIDLAKLSLDLYVFNDPTNPDPYKAKEIDVEKAEISAAEAKDQMRQLARSLYYSIRQLEEQYAGLEHQAAVAGENLRVAKLKYDLGMVTRTDLATAESALAEAQKALLDAAAQHEVLIMAFEKPWAYAGAAASGAGGGSGSAAGAAGASGGRG